MLEQCFIDKIKEIENRVNKNEIGVTIENEWQ